MSMLLTRLFQPRQRSVVAISQVFYLSTRKGSNKTARKYKSHRGMFTQYYADVHHYQHELLLRKVPKFLDIDVKQADKLLLLLKEFGFTWQDIMENPKILLMPSYSFYYKIHLLKECGVKNPNIHDLLFCKGYMNSEISFLRFFGAICEDTNVLELLWENIQNLQLPPTVLEEAKQRYPEIETTTLGELHIHFLKHYFSQRFNVDIEKMEAFLLKILNKKGPIDLGPSAQMSFKALSMYPAICDILLNHLKYDFTHISVYPSLLNIYPTSVEKLLEEFPTLGGNSIYDVALEFPDILLIPVENIRQWISLLKKYNVPTFKVTKATLHIFKTGNYKIVEERLFALSRHSEWKVICCSDNLCKILIQPFGVKRLVEVLCSDQPLKSVNTTIKLGSATGKKRGLPPGELVNYIAKELDLEQKEVKQILHSNKYVPFGLSNSNNLLKLLKDYGFSRQQMINGLEIISFEYREVNKFLEEFAENPEAQPFSEWMDSPYVLHLLMYLIKKNGLFS